jgi:hypothetical protein
LGDSYERDMHGWRDRCNRDLGVETGVGYIWRELGGDRFGEVQIWEDRCGRGIGGATGGKWEDGCGTRAREGRDK